MLIIGHALPAGLAQPGARGGTKSGSAVDLELSSDAVEEIEQIIQSTGAGTDEPPTQVARR